MKKIISSIIFGASFLTAAQSNAALLESTFTADNKIIAFTYVVDGTAINKDLSNIGNLGNWQNSSSFSFNIANGKNYEFIWDIQNDGTFRNGNPVAFLGQVSFNGLTYFTNNVAWEVKSATTNNDWQTASLNFGERNSANNQGDNIWSTRAPKTISSDAQWIWDGASSGKNSGMSFRLSIANTNAVQASAPSILGLIGAGLFFAGFRSRRM